MITSPIGTTIRKQRLSSGLTLDQLAAAAGVNRSTLVKIESGATPDPTFSVVARLLQAGGATDDDVLRAHQAAVAWCQPRLIGVGYEGLAIDELIERLRTLRVTVVADVRLNAISRKPGLSKNALAQHLAVARIDYRHFRALGNPKSNRAGYSDPADKRSRSTFRSQLLTPEAGVALDELRCLGATKVVAVLCFESRQDQCHRNEVLAAVTATASGH